MKAITDAIAYVAGVMRPTSSQSRWNTKPHTQTASAASIAVLTPGPKRGRIAAYSHTSRIPTTNVATTLMAIALPVIPRPCSAGATATASASNRGPSSMPKPTKPTMFATTPAASPAIRTFEVLMAISPSFVTVVSSWFRNPCSAQSAPQARQQPQRVLPIDRPLLGGREAAVFDQPLRHDRRRSAAQRIVSAEQDLRHRHEFLERRQ